MNGMMNLSFCIFALEWLEERQGFGYGTANGVEFQNFQNKAMFYIKSKTEYIFTEEFAKQCF